MRNSMFPRPTMLIGYFMSDNLLISRHVRKTIEYIEKNIYNFPNSHKVLKDRIINACYDILENVYRANVDNSIEPKKEAIVQIKMLNFYFKQAFDKELITKKKFMSYGRYLAEIHDMLYGWINYETGK